MKRRLLYLLLCLCLVLAVAPLTVMAEEVPVAKIGETTYSTLDAAMDAAFKSTSNVTVTVLADSKYTTFNGTSYFGIFGMYPKTVTMDLNGKLVTMECEVSLIYGNELVITGNGKMIFENGSKISALMKGDTKPTTITIQNGTFVNNTSSHVIGAGYQSSVIVNNGTFSGTEDTPIIKVSDATSEVVLNGGTFQEGFLSTTVAAPNVTKSESVNASTPDGYIWKDNKLVQGSYAADVNGIKYDNFTDAWNAAVSAGTATITLLDDAEMLGTYTVSFGSSKNITLDLNGKKLNVTSNNGSTWGFNGGKLTVQNGVLDLSVQLYGISDVVVNNATVNGTISVGKTLQLNSGDFTNTILDLEYSSKNPTVTKGDGVTVATPEGYIWNNNTLVEFTGVADVNGTKYETLHAAINAATEGQTVTLLVNVEINETINIESNDDIILDLNGKTITVSDDVNAFCVEGTLTVKDTVGTAEVAVPDEFNGTVFIVEGGEIIISSSIFDKLPTDYLAEDCIVKDNGDDTYSIEHDPDEETVWITTDTTHEKVLKYCRETVVAEEAHEWENGICIECYYECKHEDGEAICIATSLNATTHKLVYTCCDAVAVEEEGHKWDNGICSECSYECAHTGGTAYCNAKAICSLCSTAYGELDADNHSKDSFTYTASGLTHDKFHACCGEKAGNEAHTYVNGVCSLCAYTCCHEGGVAYCNAKALCSICSTAYGEFDKDNHSSNAYTYTDMGLTHAKLHECCGEREVYEGHTYENGSCICGASEPAKEDSNAGEVIADIVEIAHEIVWRNLALLIINAITSIFG